MWAAFRPLDVGHDTALYVEVFINYFDENSIYFPDLFFNAIAYLLSTFFNQLLNARELGGRFFLIFIALFQSLLLFIILIRKKYTIEAIILAIGFGPLIFMDILRQGLSMLFVGIFVSFNRWSLIFLLSAIATHPVSLIALLKIPLDKIKSFYIFTFILIAIPIIFILSDGIIARYNYYSLNAGYLSESDLNYNQLSLSTFSVLNFLVLAFFFYSAVIGGFTKLESSILSILYIFSVFVPLLHRIYLFYFFTLSCSRDVLIKNIKIKFMVFNFLYAVVALKFFTNAFFVFG